MVDSTRGEAIESSATETGDAAQEVRPLIIERGVQMALAMRVVAYWIVCVGYFAAILFFSQWMYAPDKPFLEHVVDYSLDMLHWVPAMLVLLPMVVYEMLTFSQKFLRPVVQVRDAMRQAVTSEPEAAAAHLQRLEVDEDAFFQDLVACYNELRASATTSRDSDEYDAPSVDATTVDTDERVPVLAG